MAPMLSVLMSGSARADSITRLAFEPNFGGGDNFFYFNQTEGVTVQVGGTRRLFLTQFMLRRSGDDVIFLGFRRIQSDGSSPDGGFSQTRPSRPSLPS